MWFYDYMSINHLVNTYVRRCYIRDYWWCSANTNQKHQFILPWHKHHSLNQWVRRWRNRTLRQIRLFPTYVEKKLAPSSPTFHEQPFPPILHPLLPVQLISNCLLNDLPFSKNWSAIDHVNIRRLSTVFILLYFYIIIYFCFCMWSVWWC